MCYNLNGEDTMFTIKNIENTIIINKSKFITNIFCVDNLDEINNYLEQIRSKYKDATHHCYAYILDNTKRFNDDNEPSGTAGMPILDCLEKNNLNHVLCVVTRYFGGIKLGAGGLVRAYSNSVSSALNNAIKMELINGFEVVLKFSYNKIDEIDKTLENYEVTNKEFDNDVTYIANIDLNLKEKLENMCELKIKKEIIIKRVIS